MSDIGYSRNFVTGSGHCIFQQELYFFHFVMRLLQRFELECNGTKSKKVKTKKEW